MNLKKVKYVYNPQTLQFDTVEISTKTRLLQLFGFLSATLVFAFIIVVLAFKFIDSPKEKRLKREIGVLQAQYDLINKELDSYSKVLAELEDRDDNFYRVIFETDPIPSSVRQAGIGGSSPYRDLENYSNSDLLISSKQKLDRIKRQVYIQSKSYDKIADMVKNREEFYRSMPAIQPVSNKDLKRTASGYGMRIHPIYKTHRMHNGIDFTAPSGTDVFATGVGVVEKVENGSGYGNHIIINHGYNFKTVYAHLSKVMVREGQKINRGDVIGKVGSTGLSTAPHLHYEVWKYNKPVNPAMYFYNDLSPDEYVQLIDISSRMGQSFD
ncbi:MAG: M23 family metallopeptidase [Bacteroidetes bacterium]|nr:M23 family metallopeptidase [Bacteroidota bacterium]MCB9043187.1 M23 family metallopeptidase [Chitinophagales bacterium]